eukprot:TRINITY_DN584_c0_g1_i1.p1 TRINITY_DN584_c0_g1~~TRINITY_DN584_c0_g1_i1.p1  ORF type:complete len:336 (+),score=46.62 TRINITY_DN584_c0_g1_i1:37-1044(+)
MQTLDLLPFDVLNVIFSNVPLPTLFTLLKVCKRIFNHIEAPENNFWKSTCIRWWNERNLDLHGDIRSIVSESEGFLHKSWKWFVRCFAIEQVVDGLGSHMITLSGASKIILIGNFKKGELEGEGIQVFRKNDKSRFAISNSFKIGKIDGQTVFVWRSGAKYVGNYSKGHRTGHGIHYFVSGDVYEGEYSGKKEGYGIYRFNTGVVYEGHWKKGLMNGNGSLFWPQTGFKYEGGFLADVPTDENSCLHPNLREILQKGKCTTEVTGTQKHFGQFYYKCQTCQIPVCMSCFDRCHVNCRRDVEKKWSPGRKYCRCGSKNSHCQLKSVSYTHLTLPTT